MEISMRILIFMNMFLLFILFSFVLILVLKKSKAKSCKRLEDIDGAISKIKDCVSGEGDN